MKLKLCSAIGIIALVAPGVVPMAVPAASAVSCAVVERLSPGSVHPGDWWQPAAPVAVIRGAA